MNAWTHQSHRRRLSGFTVVELIVAAGITAMLAATMIAIVSGVLGTWSRATGNLVSSNQAKLALDQLTTDLEGAIFRSDGNVWLAATVLDNRSSASISDSGLTGDRHWSLDGVGASPHKPRSTDDSQTLVLDQPSISECRFGMAGVWLRFFTTKLDDDGESAPVAVSYQIVRRDFGSSTAPDRRYALYRSEVRPTSSGSLPGTFEAGYNLDPVAGGYIVPDAGQAGNVGTIVRPRSDQIIANSVVDFGVRFYVREGNVERLVFPATAGGLPSNGSNAVEVEHLATSSGFDPDDPYRRRFPDFAEIQMRVLTDEGARLIQNLEAGLITGSWWEIAVANSRVFVRRVELKGRPL